MELLRLKQHVLQKRERGSIDIAKMTHFTVVNITVGEELRPLDEREDDGFLLAHQCGANGVQ